MKRTHALIAILALVSMTTVAHAAVYEHQGRSPMLEQAADAQSMIPAQWREDRFEEAATGDHEESRQQQATDAQSMIPAQWREDRFEEATATGDHHGFREQQQATTQDMIPAQWREDRFEAAGARDDESWTQG